MQYFFNMFRYLYHYRVLQKLVIFNNAYNNVFDMAARTKVAKNV